MYYYYYYNYTLKRSKLDWIQSEALDRYTRKNRICHRTAITYVFFLLLSSPPLLNASWIFLFSFLDQHYFVQQLLRQTELVDWLADWLTDLLVVHTTTTSLSLSPLCSDYYSLAPYRPHARNSTTLPSLELPPLPPPPPFHLPLPCGVVYVLVRPPPPPQCKRESPSLAR